MSCAHSRHGDHEIVATPHSFLKASVAGSRMVAGENANYLLEGVDLSNPPVFSPCDWGVMDIEYRSANYSSPDEIVMFFLGSMVFEVSFDQLREYLSMETNIILDHQLNALSILPDAFWNNYGGYCHCANIFGAFPDITVLSMPWDTPENMGRVVVSFCHGEPEFESVELHLERIGDRCYIQSEDPYHLIISLASKMRIYSIYYDPCNNEETVPPPLP